MLVISIPFYVEKNYFFSRVRKVGIWGSCTYILPVFRAFLHLFDGGRMSVDVGQKQTFPKSEIFCVFPFLHCRLFVVTVGDGHFHTFYIEKIFTFFLAYVKYTYECHRLSLPSFSGFFALFLWRSVTVDQIITTCHPYAGSELKIGSIILSLLAILALAIRVVKHRSGLCRLGRTPCRLWSRLFAALQENPRIFVHRGTPLLWNGLNGIRWLFAAALRVAAFGGSGRFFILV